jgi:beta-1,4-mannosyl-glycoprotein beta-1,4-N-acetylglucosaminyltransferase
MGGSGEKNVKKRVAEKVRAAAHQEFNNRETLSQTEDLIDDGKDIFGREAQFRIVPIDDTYPRYLRDHISEYSYLIKKPDSRASKALRHIRMKARKAAQRLVRGVRRYIH